MKVKVRNKLRKVWKREFLKRGITYCELRLPACWGIVHGFAHAKKSDELKPEEYNKVIAACNICHKVLDEQMTHEDMDLLVSLIIETSSWATRTEDLNLITRKWKLT